MNKTGWIVFSVAIVALLGGLVAWTRISNPPVDLANVDINTVLAASSQSGNIGDHSRGNADGKILLIEYGDFQCPSCSEANTNVNQLLTDYGDKITFVFRNFPLTTIHPNARAAAGVAEAAGLQGKYWEMHDLLYTNQNDWNNLDGTKRTDVFNGYASSLGLNTTTLTNDAASASVSQKIAFDQAIGRKLDINATPTFYLNGEKVDSTTSDGIVSGDLTQIKTKLDALIKEKR